MVPVIFYACWLLTQFMLDSDTQLAGRQNTGG